MCLDLLSYFSPPPHFLLHILLLFRCLLLLFFLLFLPLPLLLFLFFLHFSCSCSSSCFSSFSYSSSSCSFSVSLLNDAPSGLSQASCNGFITGRVAGLAHWQSSPLASAVGGRPAHCFCRSCDLRNSFGPVSRFLLCGRLLHFCASLLGCC